MSGNWQGSTRRARLPADWPAIRTRIIARDGGVCQLPDPGTGLICGAPGTDVDHRRRGDDHRDTNLWLLCTAHHGRKSAAEGGNSFTPLHRPPDVHPSLR